MVNLYKMLKYKSGKSITTALNKASQKDMAEKFKPYDKLEYKDCVDILEVIGEFLPKTKQSLVSKLLNEYLNKVENGVLAKEKIIMKVVDKEPLPVVVYKHKEEEFSLSEELELIGFSKDKYMDYPAIYIRFLKAIGHSEITEVCNKFINAKLNEKFKTLTNRKAKESLEFFEFKMDFVRLLFTIPHLKEKYDKIHIDELIYCYKFFLNHSFALSFAESRLSELKEQKNLIAQRLENETKENEINA